jgi:2-C-methyl-D-erythritol 4-phosphate cytidylyltransferase
MGFNKLLAPLNGVPVIVRTLQTFDRCDAIDEIIVVAGDEVRDALKAFNFAKLKTVLPGGSERHFSVFEGLRAVSEGASIVAVHDGGRPLITTAQISKCVAIAHDKRAVACARPVTETMKRCDEKGKITNSIERKHAWIMETPQVFDRQLLMHAYVNVLGTGLLVTDEVSAVQALGEPVYVVENTSPNLKITFPADLALAEKLIASAE